MYAMLHAKKQAVLKFESMKMSITNAAAKLPTCLKVCKDLSANCIHGSAKGAFLACIGYPPNGKSPFE